ncbi:MULTISPECIES: murein hydrolase activator EnvC [Dyadobacter]|uniref:Peptidoglycan DD-metalloendopeptidase family protein n=1 Tax=Dyadobacter chenhuakuii TaxID=2909339 RepID=A0A9X1QHN0_9BACT|nr:MULTISPECIES: peptidoglycan DD-metalloendopeptidase family protein [Dyadobacter]MCE7073648.1 peptidoglycan DD-metalloendopeptidase family protein [Dyadobacter sp. CY327]MCF2496641.1 peptidoglycan DD-metalloendopeptidase family protein [Dyadobacter chenhuakuii]MCF2501590.1 peptidoglycan DD-metalloendopeptidase family protein [Dyadobacter chenhuakuii]MCF2521042.1 peptidoglycan DD-metalloendopeptidase family protein [Dyadobacter sp. CY351]USJ29895.1 peptidoglycan DD-metalloendopeptidase family
MPFQRLYFRRLLLLLTFIFCASLGAYAQKSREQLEREKSENQSKIREIQGILRQTSSQKNVNLGQLKALNQQINTYKKQIDLLSDDLDLLNKELGVLERKRQALDSSLAKLKTEYGHMIYEASKRNVYFNQLVFLFSSGTFNQFVLRYKYLKQYTEARQGQVKEMEVLQGKLMDERRRITAKQNQQKTVLNTRVTENTKLEGLKTKQNEVIQELSQKEVELRKQIAENKRATDLLEANIRRIAERERRERIERERREREEREARRKAERERLARENAEREKKGEAAVAAKPEEEEAPISSGGMSEEETTLASSFTASQNRLPWPVKGFVSGHFGQRPHAVLKGVMVDNLGVDIQTTAGEPVRSVYDGVVLDVTEMPGMGNVVAIQHGNYMTIYAKMNGVTVRAGQKVKARENIGRVATDSDGTSELQFQIWKNTSRLNPESWLIRR